MQYLLSITNLIAATRDGKELRCPITCVLAEADLGLFAYFGLPAIVAGHFIDLTEEQILYLNDATGGEVLFRDARYRFKSIAPTGSFKLVRKS